MGQSPIVTVTASKIETDFELQFGEGWMQCVFGWQRMWAENQQGLDELSSESESSDDNYVSYRTYKKYRRQMGYEDTEESDDTDTSFGPFVSKYYEDDEPDPY